MELMASNIQVLLQAAEFLERKEREAEHGYASLVPYSGEDTIQSQKRPKPRKALKSVRSLHNELEKHRRAQLRHCLEQLKQHVPLNSEHSRSTTLSLLHQARLHIKKLEKQEQKAQQLKKRLQCEQQSLYQRLQVLLGYSSVQRLQVNSLDSSQLSSERSDSEQEDAEVDVEGLEFSGIEDAMVASFSTGHEHSYSNASNFWL
ncbi:max dimerization protein 3 isoform X2 [Eublepharis macularius]|uniref:Max dimerization protein 3 n=1 Tax=Eublepharis macularius TaxID=481883 RepID=A0AA97KVC0_EUBMA|nr:max dimerization protein 3 isoform X2 [Eublepharis macularius]